MTDDHLDLRYQRSDKTDIWGQVFVFWWTDRQTDISESRVAFATGKSVVKTSYTNLRFSGTLAFGSLILSFIRMLRVLLEWIEDKIKEYGADNPLMKCIMCFCKCCLWCLEKFIRFINRNAYVMTAIYGYNFCTGARKSFVLLTKNAVRAVVLDKVADFVLFIGKLLVVVIVASVTYLLFSNQVRQVKYFLCVVMLNIFVQC